jgi:putative transposase
MKTAPTPQPLWTPRRHPAHPAPIARIQDPVILLVTIVTQPRGRWLTTTPTHSAFRKAAVDAHAWSVGYYLIMPDHIHLFCSPALCPAVGIRPWTRYLKERITKRLRSAQPRAPAAWRWQADCWDTQMRNPQHYSERLAYVRMNPVRQGFVNRTEDWLWQGRLRTLRW